MDKDKLKGFIDSHKEEFEEQPRRDLWSSIEAELDDEGAQSDGGNIRKFISWAAAAVLLFGVGYGMFKLGGMQSPIAEEQVEVPEKIEQPEITIASISADMAEVEQYYITEVHEKMDELKNYEIDEDILAEIEFLQEEFDALKGEIGRSVNPEIIIQAMIDNYRLRLEILENLLEELKEEHRQFKDKEVEGNEMV